MERKEEYTNIYYTVIFYCVNKDSARKNQISVRYTLKIFFLNFLFCINKGND